MLEYKIRIASFNENLQGFLDNYSKQGFQIHSVSPMYNGDVCIVMVRVVEQQSTNQRTYMGSNEGMEVRG